MIRVAAIRVIAVIDSFVSKSLYALYLVANANAYLMRQRVLFQTWFSLGDPKLLVDEDVSRVCSMISHSEGVPGYRTGQR